VEACNIFAFTLVASSSIFIAHITEVLIVSTGFFCLCWG